MKILLIAGGWSPERNISLKGAANVQDALVALGHKVTFFDLACNFSQLLNAASQHDFAFINLHGAPGEDGLIQALLDTIHCPYQGSGPAGSFLALNKAASKEIFRNSGIKTADWELLPAMPDENWLPLIGYPLFVKSNTGGSSLHLGRATNRDELFGNLVKIFTAGSEALLEPELSGKEITCGILGEEALPPILIEPVEGDFFDFNSKYMKNGAREICPAPIGAEAIGRVQALALKAHKALGLSGYSRADFIFDQNGNFTILEVNTLPGMTATSLVPQEAAEIGIEFKDLIQKLIDLGLATKR